MKRLLQRLEHEIYKGNFMINERLTDDDRLTEVGQILALGALRIINKSPIRAAKAPLAAAAKTRHIVDGGEKFGNAKP